MALVRYIHVIILLIKESLKSFCEGNHLEYMNNLYHHQHSLHSQCPKQYYDKIRVEVSNEMRLAFSN